MDSKNLSQVASQYIGAASSQNDEYRKLNVEQKKELERLQKSLKALRQDEDRALKMLSIDYSNSKVDAAQYRALKALINSEYTAKCGVVEAQIVALCPSMTFAVKDTVERAVVSTGEKTGEVLGNALQAPVQSIIGFGRKFWTGARGKIATEQHGLVS